MYIDRCLHIFARHITPNRNIRHNRTITQKTQKFRSILMVSLAYFNPWRNVDNTYCFETLSKSFARIAQPRTTSTKTRRSSWFLLGQLSKVTVTHYSATPSIVFVKIAQSFTACKKARRFSRFSRLSRCTTAYAASRSSILHPELLMKYFASYATQFSSWQAAAFLWTNAPPSWDAPSLLHHDRNNSDALGRRLFVYSWSPVNASTRVISLASTTCLFWVARRVRKNSMATSAQWVAKRAFEFSGVTWASMLRS